MMNEWKENTLETVLNEGRAPIERKPGEITVEIIEIRKGKRVDKNPLAEQMTEKEIEESPNCYSMELEIVKDNFKMKTEIDIPVEVYDAIHKVAADV